MSFFLYPLFLLLLLLQLSQEWYVQWREKQWESGKELFLLSCFNFCPFAESLWGMFRSDQLSLVKDRPLRLKFWKGSAQWMNSPCIPLSHIWRKSAGFWRPCHIPRQQWVSNAEILCCRSVYKGFDWQNDFAWDVWWGYCLQPCLFCKDMYTACQSGPDTPSFTAQNFMVNLHPFQLVFK